MRTLFVSYVKAQMLLWLERTKLSDYPCTVLLHLNSNINIGVLMILFPYSPPLLLSICVHIVVYVLVLLHLY